MVSYQDIENAIINIGPSEDGVWWIDIRVELGRQILTNAESDTKDYSREECALAVDSDQLRNVLRDGIREGRLTQHRGFFKLVKTSD